MNMKKSILSALAVIIILLTLNSCCQTCTYGGYKEQICRDQYTSDADYNNAIYAMEQAYWNCK